MRTDARGILAEYGSAQQLIQAIERLKASRMPPEMKAFTPHPVEGLSEALGEQRSRIPWAMFTGGVSGGLLGYGMQYFAMVVDYPINAGGRPLHSWPAFVPVTFELTILCAAVTGFIGVLVACRLPRPHHPCFEIPQFERASQDRFFLLVQPRLEHGGGTGLKQMLRETAPLSVSEVSPE